MQLKNRTLPTENYPLSIALPAAFILPVVWLVFFFLPATSIWIQFLTPVAIGFVSAAIFGGRSVWRLLLVDLLAVIFYIIASCISLLFAAVTSGTEFSRDSRFGLLEFFGFMLIMYGVYYIVLSLPGSMFGHIFARMIGRDETDL